MPAAPLAMHTQHAATSSASPKHAAIDFAHRSPTQHARVAEDMSSALQLAPAALAAAQHVDDMADTADEQQHTKQHANKEHKHAELFVNTARSHSSAIPADSSSGLVAVPPAGLHSHSPSSSAEPSSTHSHSSTQSSTDCSPAMAYRGLQISVAGHAGSSGDRQATSSQSGSASSANITDSSDGSNNGGGSVHPASGNQDAMQLATPHPVPASTQVATHSGSVASAASASTVKADVDMPTPSQSSNGTTPAAAIKAEPSSAMESECSSAASTPASGAVNASATPATDSTPASQSSSSSSGTPEKKSGGRYKPVRTLQNSLFGQVQLAFDSHKGVEVAVKVSHADLVNPKNQGAGAATSAADAAATARSQAGVSVLEDVRREARILRLLLGADQPPFTTATIDDASCGLSNALLNAIHLPANAVVQPGATNPLTIKQQFLDSISKGKKSIAGFYDEVEAESFHYLISEYISGGDLFSVLTAQPAHKVSEGVARQWFYQLCCSVRYLHANSVAHLDLSLENICMDSHGHIRLIDFGLAAQHPRYAGDKKTILSDGSVQRNASNHIRLISESAATSSCDCAACKISSERLKETDPAILTALKAGYPLHKLKYLCRPVCEKVHKPGKLGYMSPELYANQSWDAYAHDIFGLGVILYSMLTGRPPFTRPDEASDVWFRVLHSGQWLMPQVRQQPPASIYNTLSPNALHLIDLLIKPQHMRPSIDVVLKHPWLNPSHPGNAGAIPSSKLALGSRGAGLQLGKDGRKIMQRRGSD